MSHSLTGHIRRMLEHMDRAKLYACISQKTVGFAIASKEEISTGLLNRSLETTESIITGLRQIKADVPASSIILISGSPIAMEQASIELGNEVIHLDEDLMNIVSQELGPDCYPIAPTFLENISKRMGFDGNNPMNEAIEKLVIPRDNPEEMISLFAGLCSAYTSLDTISVSKTS